MTPKQKADVLFTSHYMILFDSDSDKGEEILVSLLSIKSALITVDEMIKYMPSVNGRPPNYQEENEYTSEYWQKVKTELNKL